MGCVEVMRKALNRHVNATTPRPDGRYGRRKKSIELSQLLAAVYTFSKTFKAQEC